MGKNTKLNKLSPEEERVILRKGTEMPGTGEYLHNKQAGTYVCRQCDEPLYKSDSKFESHCGWPSFDDEITGAVKRVPDADGRRVEIVCANCNGHLGHVFKGEMFTPKNIRHCVNSVSLKFIPSSTQNIQKAIFAGGCFWGVEYFMEQEDGVIEVKSGYTGGNKENPTYEEVCANTVSHIEAVEITFDADKVDFEELLKVFFEIHDFTQTNGQGPDIGPQYLSRVFVLSDKQREITEGLIKQLTEKGHSVATQIIKAKQFWPAEAYHQNYYTRKGGTPYCHGRKKIF